MILSTHEHEVELDVGESFKIVAFSDLHYGARSCNVKRFRSNVLERNADDSSTMFIDVGDTFDCIRPTDIRNRPHEIAEHLLGREDIVDAQYMEVAAMWKEYGIDPSRLLGKAHGNHEDTILKYCGANPTERYCALTEQTNLGYSFFKRILIRQRRRKKYKGVVVPLVIFGSHGFAGGRMEGASVNTYINYSFRFPGAQLYLYGHNHRKWAQRIAQISPSWGVTGKNKKDADMPSQNDKTIVIANTGTYMMTQGTGTAPAYSERAGMYPTEIGHPEFVVTLQKTSTTREIGRPELDLDIRAYE